MLATILIVLSAFFILTPLQRPLKVTLTSVTRRNKIFKNRKVIKIAKEILADSSDAVASVQNPKQHPELRVLIPIVTDARKRVELMLKDRALSSQWFSFSQKETEFLLAELIRIEKVLRSVPKSKLTLEQVLAGQFEETFNCLEVMKP